MATVVIRRLIGSPYPSDTNANLILWLSVPHASYMSIITFIIVSFFIMMKFDLLSGFFFK
jgi:hypothetical protein